MQFIRSYKDEYQIYFLLEYIQGVELFDAIRDIGNNNSKMLFKFKKDF